MSKRPHISTPSLQERLDRWVEYDPNGGCWLWAGVVSHKGYGRAHFGGHLASVHRLTYEHSVGPISAGHHIDHLCGVRCCCNPAHLEAVEPAVNNARSNSPSAANGRRTHCKRGHPLSGDNLSFRRNGARRCVACNRLNASEAKRRRPPKTN